MLGVEDSAPKLLHLGCCALHHPLMVMLFWCRQLSHFDAAQERNAGQRGKCQVRGIPGCYAQHTLPSDNKERKQKDSLPHSGTCLT